VVLAVLVMAAAAVIALLLSGHTAKAGHSTGGGAVLRIEFTAPSPPGPGRKPVQATGWSAHRAT
jgi:hypothetical protein